MPAQNSNTTSDAKKAGMSEAQWNALSAEQRTERRKHFGENAQDAAIHHQSVKPIQQPTAHDPLQPAPPAAQQPPQQPHSYEKRPGDGQTVAGMAHVSNPANVIPKRDHQAEAAAGATEEMVRPAVPKVEHTDAQRAGLSEDRWNALSDTDKDAMRAQFLDPAFRTDAQRTGLTQSQWDALSPAEQNLLRTRFPSAVQKEIVTTPSPPDLSAVTPPGGQSPPREQPLQPPVKTEEERIADAKRDPREPDPKDSLLHLPNAPGGRNNPTMSNYDPSRPPTE